MSKEESIKDLETRITMVMSRTDQTLPYIWIYIYNIHITCILSDQSLVPHGSCWKEYSAAVSRPTRKRQASKRDLRSLLFVVEAGEKLLQ